jgi:predicted AlkP superfamily pyrophosphatase or phosphodiesterase
MAGEIKQAQQSRVVWVNIDGLCAAPFNELLADGKLANFKRVFAHCARVERAASVFPTVTLSCQASLATGCFPSKHGLIGNAWFDRFGKQPKFRNYADTNSALAIYGFKLLGAPTVVLPPRAGPALANNDLSGSARTIYEELGLHKVRSAVALNQISRGARDWIRPSRLDVAQFALCHDGHLEHSHFERTATKRAVHYIEDSRRLPRLFMAYFPGLDGHTHRHGPKTQAGYIRTVLDPLFGRLLDALMERHKLDEYNFFLTSDHGHAQTRDVRTHWVTDETVAAILRENGRRPFFLKGEERLKSVDTILLNQGGGMHIAVRNAETRHWYDPPRLREDLLALGVALIDASKKQRGQLHPGWLDIALVKDQESKRYIVLRDHKVYAPEKFFSFHAHKEKYPDAVRRLDGYFSQRSADLVLLSNYDSGFYFSADHPKAGTHGGLDRQDSLVPLIVSGPNVRECAIPEASIVDVAPTIAAIFGAKLTTAQGKPLPILETIGSKLAPRPTPKNIPVTVENNEDANP